MTCRKAKRLLVQLAALELKPQDGARLREHMAACPRCREEYEAIVATTAVARKRAVPEPEPAQWAAFDCALRRRLADEMRRKHSLSERLRLALQTRWPLSPKRSFALAGVAAMLIAGLVLIAVLRADRDGVGDTDVVEANLQVEDLDLYGVAAIGMPSLGTVGLENDVLAGVAELDKAIRLIDSELGLDSVLDEWWISG